MVKCGVRSLLTYIDTRDARYISGPINEQQLMGHLYYNASF